MGRFPSFDEKINAKTYWANFKAFVLGTQNTGRQIDSILEDLSEGTIDKTKAIIRIRQLIRIFNGNLEVHK